MKVGVLALQGAVEPHLEMFRRLGQPCLAVRQPADLEEIDRIILPGGESTTMLSLLERSELLAPLSEFGRSHPVWGICAGAILIAREVEHPRQRSLGLINILARRNHYGSQLDSFKTPVQVASLTEPIEADFIRAPLLSPLSASVRVLAEHGGAPVLMQEGRILASSFHTELGTNPRLHALFLSL